MVTQAHDGRRQVIMAADAVAQALGIHPGLPLAHARAMVPELAVMEANPTGDAAALADLAAWCLRYAPLTSAIPPDGIWIDVTGCAHLHGGEQAMLTDLVGRLTHAGIAARAAVADTPGAAHAVARHTGQDVTIVPPGAQAEAIALLPVAALRLTRAQTDGLRRLGVDRIGQLASLPRGPLAHRFGFGILQRLDQALGHVAEAIAPVLPPEVIQHQLAFPEPLLTADAFSAAIAELVHNVCARLERAGQGARRLDLIFERVDGGMQVVRIGTARPARDDRHLARLLAERIEAVDPGLGVEAMRLVVTLAEPLAQTQAAVPLGNSAYEQTGLGMLVDRLQNRFGPCRVYRIRPIETDVPERAEALESALSPPPAWVWPPHWPRPVRLLTLPQPVEVMGLLPDHPPKVFTWRRVRHRIRRADGPERIYGEWWRRDGEVRGVRDYWVVEDETGRRFWLFRRGDGADQGTGDLSWFLHGFF
jgi:protein ImuB